MNQPSLVIAIASALFVACSGDGTCPVGSIRLGGTCVDDGQPSSTDASIPDADAAATCGDGRVDQGEACDDGNDAAGDGCSGDACIPEEPVIRGAPSMAPRRVLWTWSRPEGATRIELRLDGETLAPTAGTRLSPSLPDGEHTLEVRACNEHGCSGWAIHRTIVEGFGQLLPVGLIDSARTFARTSLGHPVAIGCERCLSSADGTSPGAAPALSNLERALTRDSDVIALPIASVEGELYVTSGDVATSGRLARLNDVLAQQPLADSDALVLLDLVENEPRVSGAIEPDELADALRSALDAAPQLARNGRPLLVRTTVGNRAYLSAVRDALTDVPEVAPYVRYVLRDPEGPWAEFYAASAFSKAVPLVPSADFVDAVSVGYGAPDLPNRINLSRRAGRAVIIDGVPGSGTQHGHALISALRDQADLIITRYPADRAQSLVVLPNRSLHLDAATLAPNADAVTLTYDATGGPQTAGQALAPVGAPLVGAATPSGTLPPALAFGANPNGRFLELQAAELAASGPGFLSTAFGGFSGPYSATDGRATSAIAAPPISNFGLVVNTATSAEFGTFSDSDVTAACGKPLATLLSSASSHWFVLYLDVRWTLIIDGTCTVTKPAATQLLAAAKAGTQPRILSSNTAITAASLLRFPSGYANDVAF